ncbi:MAG: DUF6323 family protein [Firmicutes bacterium]|nr:DUF6323 family protein [Bacillota bacterium]
MEKNIHMEERDWIELLSGKNQVQKVMEMNQKTEKFGLALTQADAEMLVEVRREELKKQQRVEFGEGILPKLIFTFCDSAYINQENYVETLIQGKLINVDTKRWFVKWRMPGRHITN